MSSYPQRQLPELIAALLAGLGAARRTRQERSWEQEAHARPRGGLAPRARGGGGGAGPAGLFSLPVPCTLR